MRITHMTLASLLFAAVAVGCGGAQPKARNVDDVTASMRAASEVGANDVPEAALYLHLAQEQVDASNAFAAKGDARNAQLALDRAQVDADLALQLAKTERQQTEALAARNKVMELKRDSH